MPLYDGRATDKHCVILDIGHAYTKCGFAREPGPRWIISSEIQDSEKSKALKIWDYKSPEELYNNLKVFLHTLYFRYLVVNPKDRRVIIVESVLCPTEFRETLAKVLFTHFEVPSVLFLPSHLMVIYTLGISSAMVIDVGYSETIVLPIFEKLPILNAWEAIPLGAQAIHRRLEAELMDNGEVKGSAKFEKLPLGSILNEPEPLPENVFEDIKVRACFVSPPHRSAAIQEFFYSQTFKASSPTEKDVKLSITPAMDVDYPLDGQKILKISGVLREIGPEVLFEQDADGQSVATIVLDSILRCPIDIRKKLIENIVLTGGTTMLTGFKHRFMGEIKKLLASNKYATRLPVKTVKIHQPPGKENYVAWLGGAIFGATDAVVTRVVSREQYLSKGHISDWSDQEWIDTMGN